VRQLEVLDESGEVVGRDGQRFASAVAKRSRSMIGGAADAAQPEPVQP
jgi:hypothetical protein